MAVDSVKQGETMDVEVIRAQPAPEQVAAAEPSTTMRAIDHARAAGMLPKMFPGPKLRPSTENPKAWLYDAAKLRGLGDEDQITRQEFDQRIAAISTVLVR